jgi:phosphoglycolate phosphatase-like HAD superfamily hydrolase
MNIEALIFDVDGTLADTEDAHRRAFNRAFADHGLDWDWSPDVYVDLLRIAGGRERISAFIDALEVSANERARLAALVPSLHARKTDHYTRGIGGAGLVLREGIARLLDDGQARGCRLAIASTTSAANIDSLVNLTLGANGLERFSVIACGDQVRAKKPAAGRRHLFARIGAVGSPAGSRRRLRGFRQRPALGTARRHLHGGGANLLDPWRRLRFGGPAATPSGRARVAH